MTVLVRFTLLASLVAFSIQVWAGVSNPRVLIVAQNSGTEIADLLVPFAVLSKAGIQTEIVATETGPVNLMNGLELLNLRTIEEIGPTFADMVVVPAVHYPEQESLLEWLRASYSAGSIVASICDGAEVLAATGLLDGRRATGHFYSAKRRQSKFPEVEWLTDVRYVEDANFFSTAGISASAPASVRFVERLVGETRAKAVARYFGIDQTNPLRHDSSKFSVGFGEVRVGLFNWLKGLRKRKYNLRAEGKVDEYALALSIDALTRTYRAAVAVESPNDIVVTVHGLKIRGTAAFSSPDWQVNFSKNFAAEVNGQKSLTLSEPTAVLPTIFRHLAQEYGNPTASFVGMQLELPDRGAGLH